MRRERATNWRDLPHQYVDGQGVCRECLQDVLDARHTAWEKASLAQPSNPWFLERERGT